MLDLIVSKKSKTREIITFRKRNSKNEKIQIEITKCGSKDSPLMKKWKKKNYIQEELESWWDIKVYAIKQNGICIEKYNPIVKNNDIKGAYKYNINFDWILEATTENKEKIINEIIRLAFKKENKEKNLKFIKDFSKIKVKFICKDLNIIPSNLWSGKTSAENINKVKKEIEKKYKQLEYK